MKKTPEDKEHEIADLKEQLEAEKKRSEDCRTRLMYLQADFENLKKRCDRQIHEASQYSNERIVVQLLEVVDELELAVKTAKTTNLAITLIEGVQMTLKRLRKVLEQEGVSPIESEGTPFDPSKHNAVATVERDDVDGCVVLEEVRKGYIMNDKVIRPCIAKVSVKPSSSESQNKEENKK
jgi:molecular chaperone GrpE